MVRRFSIATLWSVLAAAVLTVALLAVAIAVIANVHPPGGVETLVAALVLPIAAFVVLAHFLHRRRFSFDEATGTLTVRNELCFVPVGQPSCVPLWHVTQVELTERWNEGPWYAVRIEIEGRRWFDVVSTQQVEEARTALHEVSEAVAHAKQEHYRFVPDTDGAHA